MPLLPPYRKPDRYGSISIDLPAIYVRGGNPRTRPFSHAPSTLSLSLFYLIPHPCTGIWGAEDTSPVSERLEPSTSLFFLSVNRPFTDFPQSPFTLIILLFFIAKGEVKFSAPHMVFVVVATAWIIVIRILSSHAHSLLLSLSLSLAWSLLPSELL